MNYEQKLYHKHIKHSLVNTVGYTTKLFSNARLNTCPAGGPLPSAESSQNAQSTHALSNAFAYILNFLNFMRQICVIYKVKWDEW